MRGWPRGWWSNGSLSKTAVNGAAGARSQLSGITCAALTVVTMLFLTGLFEQLPEATLAAVVIAAVVDLVDVPALRRLVGIWAGTRASGLRWITARADFAAAAAALLGVLLFGTLPGLFIGIGVSLLLVLSRASQPHVATLGHLRDTGGAGDGSALWVDVERHPDAVQSPGAVVLRVESGLFFGNADHVRERVRHLVGPDTRVVVLDGGTTPWIDVTAADALGQLRGDLARDGITLRLVHPVGQVLDVLNRSAPAGDRLMVHATVEQALAARGTTP